MPSAPSAARPPRRFRRAAALAPLAVLAACAQQGDFGRPAPSVWNGLVNTTGSLAAAVRDEPSAAFAYTDDETTLRDRAWRYLMPEAGRDVFDGALANLTRSRLLPPGWRPDAVEAYHETLAGEAVRSQVSRYRRIGEDISADARLMPAFVATALRVRDADALRLRGLPYLKSLDDDAVRDAALRVAENRCLVAWVRLETGLRLGRYRYALDHLLLEVPDSAEAAAVARSIGFLEGRRALLDPLLARDAELRCGLLTADGPVAVAPAPLVRKN